MSKVILITLVKLSLVALVLSGVFYLVDGANPAWVVDNSYYLLLILYLAAVLSVIGNIWAAHRNFLITSFIASQIVRMLLCIAALYFFISSNPGEANILVVNFFIIYLIFLIFEISLLLSNLRAEFRKPE